jgi:DNA-binding MarR family transcriptional regulator
MCDDRPIIVSLTRCDMTRLAAMAQSLLTSEFGSDLFASPAMEMLLDLYISSDRRPRSLTALTAASSASERNSQRIVYKMAKKGLLVHSRDTNDGRRVIVELTPHGTAALDTIFTQMLRYLASLSTGCGHGDVSRP